MATVRPLCTSPHWIFQNVMSSNGQNGPEWWALLLVETEARRGGVICPKAILQYWQNSGELQAVRLGAPPPIILKGMDPHGLEGQAGHPRLLCAADAAAPEGTA